MFVCVNKAHSTIHICHGDCLCILRKGTVGGGPALEYLRPSSLRLLSAGEVRESFCGATALLWLPGSGYAIKVWWIRYQHGERTTTFSHTSTFDLFNGRGPAWEQMRSLVLHLAHDPVAQTNIRNSFTAPDPFIIEKQGHFMQSRDEKVDGPVVIWTNEFPVFVSDMVGFCYVQVQIRRSVGFVSHCMRLNIISLSLVISF